MYNTRVLKTLQIAGMYIVYIILPNGNPGHTNTDRKQYERSPRPAVVSDSLAEEGRQIALRYDTTHDRTADGRLIGIIICTDRSYLLH